MEQITGLCQLLYPSRCCHRILREFIIEPECFKLIMIKSLGYGIIFGSTMVKLPQLLKLLSAKSGLGVSLSAVVLEILALTFSSSYAFANGFPFSAWGEALFILFMTSFIAFLIIYYDINKGQAFLFMIVFTSTFAILMSGHVPMKILWMGQAAALPLIISSKLVQAGSNFRNGHTGNLSAVTIILIFIGSTTRIMTSIQETGDQLIIVGYSLSSIINLILVLQMFYYWDNTNKFIRKNLAKKDK
ncbi:Mannose-P-dolichol utilization defect 1 protein [Dermatophagoides farinae]|uniref:Solute carrier family 66 member 3 n=1 Tax=Dermatophagoides farinae TaxID=6954 RepID=A0A922IBT6_DERFA|nr:Mannose-P-dolichol utilization defect 1 protein [Dermatophagoides farinae]